MVFNGAALHAVLQAKAVTLLKTDCLTGDILVLLIINITDESLYLEIARYGYWCSKDHSRTDISLYELIVSRWTCKTKIAKGKGSDNCDCELHFGAFVEFIVCFPRGKRFYRGGYRVVGVLLWGNSDRTMGETVLGS